MEAAGMNSKEYRASDGTVFTNLDEYRKYEMETSFTFRDSVGESLTKLPGEINGQPFDCLALDDCEVLLLDHTDRVKIDQVNNSKVFIGACASSVIISNCSNTTFTLATREFYVQHTQGCTFLLFCATPPEVAAASCHDLSFGPFNGVYEQHAEHMEAAGLPPDDNQWWCIEAILSSSQEGGEEGEEEEGEEEVVEPEGCYTLLTPSSSSPSLDPWAPLGECQISIPLTWPPTQEQQQHEDERDYTPSSSPPSSSLKQNLSKDAASHAASLSQRSRSKEVGVGKEEGEEGAWEAEWKERIRHKAEEEQRMIQVARDRAAQELDVFYNTRTDRFALRQENNREKEAAFLALLQEDEAATHDGRPMQRVWGLMGGREGGREGGKVDLARFRGLLEVLKEEGLPSSSASSSSSISRLGGKGGGENEEEEEEEEERREGGREGGRRRGSGRGENDNLLP